MLHRMGKYRSVCNRKENASVKLCRRIKKERVRSMQFYWCVFSVVKTFLEKVCRGTPPITQAEHKEISARDIFPWYHLRCW